MSVCCVSFDVLNLNRQLLYHTLPIHQTPKDLLSPPTSVRYNEYIILLFARGARCSRAESTTVVCGRPLT